MSDAPSTLPVPVPSGSGRPDELLPLIYDELRRIAAYRMAGEAAGHTLQPTALVHEAWLRIAPAGQDFMWGREQFFVTAGEAMRRILVESARRRGARKRGGDVEILEFNEGQSVSEESPDLLLSVDDAVEALALVDPEAAQMVNLRYFVGMDMEEVATALSISRRSAERQWTFAKAWLRRYMETAPPRATS